MIFRYPGSKARYAGILLNHMKPIIKTKFTDVFVGGGSILCAVAKNHPTVKLHANDLDERIYSFWKIIERKRGREVSELISLILNPPTIDLFRSLRESKPRTLVEKAYLAVFFNRTTFSGVATSGPIGGYGQTSKWSIGCRYNSKEMINKICIMLKLFEGRLKVTNLDFADVLNNDGMYLDPPYYEKGGDLYPKKMREIDHDRLSEALFKKENWLLSYDDHLKIRELYSKSFITTLEGRYSISGKKKEWVKKQELIISDYKL